GCVGSRSRRPVADGKGTDFELRSPDHGLAPIQRGEQAAGCDPRALVRRWPPLWSPALLIRRLFDLGGISRLGSGSCRSNTRAEVRRSSAASANRAIAIYAACSRRAR